MPDVSFTRSVTKTLRISNDSYRTGLNNNDLVIGPSGAGKTRGYVAPNLAAPCENFVITDTKGNLYRDFHASLEKSGYKVFLIDFSDPLKTECGYNPLSHVRRDAHLEADVKTLARIVCPCLDRTDPYWDYAAGMYLEALCLYVIKALPAREQTLAKAYSVLTEPDDDSVSQSFYETAAMQPDSAFAKKAFIMLQNKKADKMDASIRGILARHLDAAADPSSEVLFKKKPQFDFRLLLKPKTLLFLTVSDCDRSRDALIAMFYTQLFQYLIGAADRERSSRLPHPVRLILDDFATNARIADFDSIISVIRSRNIAVSILIQSLSQLSSLYGDNCAQTIVNNCDHLLYLGGTDLETARYFAERLDRPVPDVLNQPRRKAWLFTRGERPVELEAGV